MKIVVIGAGAMGCLYGGYLSKNNDVVLLDTYKPQVDAINNNGITVLEDDGSTNHYSNVKAYLSGTYKGEADLVIIFVKASGTRASLEENKDLFKDNTIVMTLQNGFGNEEIVKEFVKLENIVVGTSQHNSINLGDGRVKHSGTGKTTIGSLTKENNSLEKIKEVIIGAGLKAEISDDIKRLMWAKLFVNLSSNTFTAITQAPICSLIESDNTWEYAKKLIKEAIEVAKADGQEFNYDEVLANVKHLCQDDGNGFTSMSQDVKNKRVTEIETINGSVVKKGKMYNIPTPYNELVVNIIHSIEDTYKYHQN